MTRRALNLNRRIGIGTVLVAAAALVAVAVNPFSERGASARTVPTAFAPIVRTNVIERQQVAGTLDHPGNYTVANTGAAGVVSWLPALGAVVRRGTRLYEIGSSPTELIYGRVPASRDLTLGIMPGTDVRQLQQNLRALGFDGGGLLRVDGIYDVATLAAVEQWQRARGLHVTGTLPLGSVVFLPHAVRVSSQTTAPGVTVQVGAALLQATDASPAVLVPLDPGTISQLAVGDRVLVTLPDGSTVGGRVATIGRVATPSSATGQDNGQGPPSPTIPVTIALDNPHATGGLDQAPVQVAITEQEARQVLAAPIDALLAQPGGGYAVAVHAGAGTTRRVPVTTGLFDDVAGKVEISGRGLGAGTRVQVPSG